MFLWAAKRWAGSGVLTAVLMKSVVFVKWRHTNQNTVIRQNTRTSQAQCVQCGAGTGSLGVHRTLRGETAHKARHVLPVHNDLYIGFPDSVSKVTLCTSNAENAQGKSITGEFSTCCTWRYALCFPPISKKNETFCEVNEDGHLALQAHVLQTCAFIYLFIYLFIMFMGPCIVNQCQ